MPRRLNTEERRKFINLRRSFRSPVIGITGSVGKTTTLEMVRSMLETKGQVLKHHHGHGNWNNNIKTLEKLSPEYDYALFEFDFSRGNHFAEILRLIKPTIGIVTNFGDAHLNYLGGMVEIALQKSEVVKYLARQGTAILNKDDELSSTLADYIDTQNVIKFGLSHNSDYYASDIQHLGPGGTEFRLNGNQKIRVPIFSVNDVYNLLSAIATLEVIGFPLDEVLTHFEQNFQLPPGRGRLHEVNGRYLLDESFSANPRAIAKGTRALVGFRPMATRIIYIVSDMTEVGVNIQEQHLNMGYFISALPIDCLITLGTYSEFIGKGVSLIRHEDKKLVHTQTIDGILENLKQVAEPGSVIMAQGIGTVAFRRILNFIGSLDA
jgi:UDP-N-acetylmuramoyl-tripeptide--D-alanyl-D-alanine ligase